MTDTRDFTSVLADAARAINRPTSVEETLEAIAQTARTSIPGFTDVGISLMHRDGTVETKAATGQLVRDLDALQYRLGEGPCVSTLHESPVIVVNDLAHDQRWPQYVPRALERGLKSQMALRLYVDESGTIGGINLYSTAHDTIEEHAPQIAEVFAAQAAVALGHVRELDQLQAAIESRQRIGQAVGIIIERYKLDEERAFGFLVRLSSQDNIKLRDVAAAVVADAVRATARGSAD